jgi:outer membrane biosynthesis protein TonB
MNAARCSRFCAVLFLVSLCDSYAQGVHWSYHTRITQTYDSAPGQKVPAPAPDFVPYPIYPREMVRAHIEGAATLQFRVDAAGRAEDIRVLKSTQ